MATYNVLEAKTHLSRLLDAVESGDEVVIARNGKPRARLVPITEAPRTGFKIGLAKGRLQIPEDFDDLDAEVLKGMDEAEAEWRELE
jgi:prevent-host-death family protein